MKEEEEVVVIQEEQEQWQQLFSEINVKQCAVRSHSSSVSLQSYTLLKDEEDVGREHSQHSADLCCYRPMVHHQLTPCFTMETVKLSAGRHFSSSRETESVVMMCDSNKTLEDGVFGLSPHSVLLCDCSVSPCAAPVPILLFTFSSSSSSCPPVSLRLGVPLVSSKSREHLFGSD
ncbi:hypothetical protein Q8A73_017970 [Channa argus]|nr:hypothetical protein Q8A73_017970 [Channa argus]